MAAARALSLGFALALLACEATPTPTPDLGAGSSGLRQEPAVAAASERGHDLFFGKAMCSTCHSVDREGTMIVGPNLGVGEGTTEPVARRVTSRGVQLDPAIYIIQSILDPDAVVVPGYARGVMKSPDDIPVALSDDEFVDLAAFILTIRATEPLDPAQLELARTQIPLARAARALRRAPPATP